MQQYHINLNENDSADYCILPGDPERCEKIAKYLSDPYFITSNREFTTWAGFLNGEKILITSTGIGGSSAAIALEELSAIGVKNFIRVGTCGGINLNVKSSDVIIPTAAIRQNGITNEYAPIEYPATANFEIVKALIDSAEILKEHWHAGVIQSKDSFYGQHDPNRMPAYYDLKNKWEAWKRLGVLGSEMECAALFIVADSLCVKCGAVLNVIWNQERKLKGFDEPDDFSTDRGIKIAVKAISILMRNDKNINSLKTENNINCLFCTRSGASAKGYFNFDSKNFTVLKGSKIAERIRPNFKTRIGNYKLRQKLERNGTILNLIFQTDFIFDSPSMAASIILGSSANGWDEWKNEDGITLKELQKK